MRLMQGCVKAAVGAEVEGGGCVGGWPESGCVQLWRVSVLVYCYVELACT